MRVADHVVQARRERIAKLLEERRYLPVAELCAEFGVSGPTARRDLAALAADRSITRTRGGALVEYNQRFPSFRDRQGQAAEAKDRIAAAAVRLVKPGMTLWLDGGTTLYAAARLLAAEPPRDLVVVTNNLPAADLLSGVDALQVHLLGGQIFRRTSLLLGPGAPAAARRWRFDLALLGVEGITARGLWNSLGEVVALQRVVIRHSTRAIVCADAAKIGRPAADFLAPVTAVDRILSDATSDAFRDAGLPASHLLPAARSHLPAARRQLPAAPAARCRLPAAPTARRQLPTAPAARCRLPAANPQTSFTKGGPLP